jgi:protein-S-isoprenylcysteine O-methyltransferase Ste14
MNLAASSYRHSSVLPPRGLLVAILVQLPLVSSSWPLRPNVLEILAGAVLMTAGATLNVWSAKLFERHDVGICPFSPVPVLVTHGPFFVSRHPMYLGLVAIALGLTVATGVLANIWISVAFAIWLHYAYVLPEERFLRDQFGASYDAYCERVPRWLLTREHTALP